MEPDRIWHVVTNPAWRPLTDADVPGYVLLLACAALLIGLTIWTYTGSAASTPRRIGILIALRLFALLLAILLALRPAAAITEIPKLPSTLIIVVDSSESMSVKDEANFTRWEFVQRQLEKCGPLLDQMRDDQQTTIYVYHFSKDFDPDRDKLTEDVKPVGKRTDFGTMLSKLWERHSNERLLRGIVIVSDGADNGTFKPALPEATRWRAICPVYTFVVGGPTASDQKDIGFTSINPDPSPVPIKAELKVRAKLNAQGHEGYKARIKLTIEGMPDKTEDFVLTKSTDNEVEITTKAPDTPGEVRVTMELVDPPGNQVSTENDKIETYLTVTREGVRVLVVSKDGWELKGIRRALATDKRFDFVEVVRTSEAPGTADDAKQFDISEQRYDVIVLGDAGPKMLTSVRPRILEEIAKLVREKGVGLMMTGGAYSFGGTAGIPGATGWRSTPIADLLPVDLPTNSPPPVKEPTSVVSTAAGLAHYVTKFSADPKKNAEAWELLNSDYLRLQGYSDMGEPKKNRAEILARANDVKDGKPLLVRIDASEKGRVLAFAASDTWLWTQPGKDEANRKTPSELHARFWKQMILWLAHQDEVEGNVWVRPEYRRIVVNGRQALKMGVRDKRGDEVPESSLKYQIVGPNEAVDQAKAKAAEREPKGGGRASFEAKVPGEYKVVVWGEGTDGAGEKIADEATARYVVYPEVSDEMLRIAANPEFLLALENAANGTAMDVARRAEQLPKFLEDMKAKAPTLSTPKPKPYPEWRRDKQKWFLPLMLILFVAVLGLEWGLRRAWGMV